MYVTEQLNVFGFLQNKTIFVILLVIFLSSSITKGELLPSKMLSFQEIHLVRCLTYISHRYFAPGRSLVISSPANYRDGQQEQIAEIQRTSIWPVVVNVDGNISIKGKREFIDRDGSYIILLPEVNFKRFVAEINGITTGGTRYKRLWNSDARFVVAGANEFSMSQQMEIFDYLSQLRIYNCIIVSSEHYVTDKKNNSRINVNNIDAEMKMVVHTWFPYQSFDRCTEVNEITLLDSWVISAQGHFNKNTDLFPGKIHKNLNGCPLKTIVNDAQSDITMKYVNHTYTNGSYEFYVKGLEYELLRVVLHQMNMTYVQVPTKDEFAFLDSTIRSLFEKEPFIALGGFVKSIVFKSFFDYTRSYIFHSFRWYVPCSIKYQRWNSIFRIFSLELWLVLIISIVIAAISITLLGRYSCTPEWQGYKTLTSALTNVWAVILGVSVSTMPRTPSLRSLFLTWVCFSLAFSTVFQAFLTTFLVDSGYKTPIQNMAQLFASGIKLVYPPDYNYIYMKGDETEVTNVIINSVKCPSYDDCVKWALYQNNISLLLTDAEAEKHYASGLFVGQYSEPLMCKLQDGAFYQTGSTMLMSHGDPLMRRVNEIIDRVVEAGIYNFWISIYMNRVKIKSRKISIVHQIDGYYSFNLYHMQPAFYLLIMGWCLSVLCFMVELLYNRVLNKKK
jgi:hypothetical protein